MRALVCFLAALILSGCAVDPPAEPLKVDVTRSDFCEIMKGVLPPTGKPRWSIKNDPVSIQDARRLGAAVDKNCSASRPSTPTPTS